MKIIKSDCWLVPQEPGFLGMYKQIELAGRTAYKSENKITEDSAKNFVEMLIKRGHYRPLEFGTIYLRFPTNINPEVIDFYDRNHWSKVVLDKDGEWYYVTTNARVITENERQNDLIYWCEPTEYHEKRITAKIVCSRAIMDEARTHTAISFIGESTRYCNYSKDRFDNQLTFIMPHWMDIKEGIYFDDFYSVLDDKHHIRFIEQSSSITNDLKFGIDIPYKYQRHLSHWCKSENDYFMELNGIGLLPQDARGILPLDIKSELAMCGYIDDWKHFFSQRCAIDAHPDMQIIANKLKDLLCL